jgi:hypothetical protein
MNSKIKNLDYSKLLFADCETIRGEETFDQSHPYYSVWQWKQRNKETNEFLSDEENIRLYYDKSALFPEWGKIACISVGFIHNDELHIKSFVGEEKEILTNLISLVKSTGRSLVFHNAEFDMPYIRKRWFINGLKTEDYLSETQGNDVGMKVWDMEKSVHDSMKLWKGINFGNTSLDELAMCFKIPSSKLIMHGNETSDYFYSGRIKELQSYCESDVAVLSNLIRVWKGDNILEPIFRQDIKTEELPLLQKIYTNKVITIKDKQKLEEILKKNKLSKKEKDIVLDLVKASLAEIDSNFGKVTNQKQIDEIINQLKEEFESN